MIHSKLILDIFDLALDTHEQAGLLRSQLPFLAEGEREHTGAGLFINFDHDKEANRYKLKSENFSNVSKTGDVHERLNRVEIRNEALNILADAEILLTNGIVDCVEIFNYNGENYPIEEPEHYELYQTWLEQPMQRIIIR